MKQCRFCFGFVENTVTKCPHDGCEVFFDDIDDFVKTHKVTDDGRKWHCSQCSETLPNDILQTVRKSKHEEKHTRGQSHSKREQGGGNNIIGKVEWTLI